MQHHQMLHGGLPENIKITDNAIIPMKERVAGRRYEPRGLAGQQAVPPIASRSAADNEELGCPELGLGAAADRVHPQLGGQAGGGVEPVGRSSAPSSSRSRHRYASDLVQGHVRVDELRSVDRLAGADQGGDRVGDVPDIDVHRGQHPAVMQPEGDVFSARPAC